MSVAELALTTPHAQVSALLVKPRAAAALLVLGHGAGAGMRHEFMEDMAGRLALEGVATLRYQFPYMEAGRRRIDPESALTATVAAALRLGVEAAGGLPVFAGGKSMGGRMTSRYLASPAAAPELVSTVQGLIFFGFPLHPANRPATARGDHLSSVQAPMLFLQGTRDALADLTLMRTVARELGPKATLHVVDGADHGFAVLKRSGRTGDEVRAELARAARQFCASAGSGNR